MNYNNFKFLIIFNEQSRLIEVYAQSKIMKCIYMIKYQICVKKNNMQINCNLKIK